MSVPAIGRAKQYTVGFQVFWNAYPRHKGASKWAAFMSYDRAIFAKIATHEQIMDGLRTFVFPEEVRFQPHPSTWLNRRCWEVDNHDIAPVTIQKALTAPPSRASWRDAYDGGGHPAPLGAAARRQRLEDCDLFTTIEGVAE